VIEYTLEGVTGAEPIYRLLTSILHPDQAAAKELAALYHERWEIETALDELKTHLRGSKIVLRSKTPDLVRQEFYGLMMTHFAIRGLMHEAALKAGEDPDHLSFLHAVCTTARQRARLSCYNRSLIAASPEVVGAGHLQTFGDQRTGFPAVVVSTPLPKVGAAVRACPGP